MACKYDVLGITDDSQDDEESKVAQSMVAVKRPNYTQSIISALNHYNRTSND